MDTIGSELTRIILAGFKICPNTIMPQNRSNADIVDQNRNVVDYSCTIVAHF